MASRTVTRRNAARGAGLALAAGALGGPAASAEQGERRTYVVCHGAWSAGWAWRKMRPLLHRPPQSQLFTPTYTGVGERAHLASPEVTLDTHIADILAVLEMEELSDVTLIGHSYGGMVATGVADRARGRIRRLIYLDAFVPADGESLYALTGQSAAPGGDWLVPPNPLPPDTSPEDVAWARPRRMPQPRGTFTTPVRIASEQAMPPRAYIRCMRGAASGPFGGASERARSRGWPVVEIDTSHNPHITAPALLVGTLDDLCRRT